MRDAEIFAAVGRMGFCHTISHNFAIYRGCVRTHIMYAEGGSFYGGKPRKAWEKFMAATYVKPSKMTLSDCVKVTQQTRAGNMYDKE
jgi:hypothetical protein